MPTKVKDKIEHSKRQQELIPGSEKDKELQGLGRAWLIAKEEFCDKRDAVVKAGENLAAFLKANKINSFVCEETRISIKTTEAKVKLVSQEVRVED
jgi:hypothetical protein